VQDEERLLEIARAVRAAGGTLLRGGAFKPRTSPYSFQGLGREGLERLAHAREETGLAIVTEVLDPREVETVGQVADVFQIGSRSMSNAPLLREVGRTNKPVLLKRGLSATVREFLLAAEYVLSEGNAQVILCERGIRGFDTVTRNVLDVGTVAYLKRATHLPVIVDPSHAAGRAELVRPLARAGLAAGADGLLVEVHPRPGEAHSDGDQAISTAEFGRLAAEARALCALDERTLVTADEPVSDLSTPTGVPA
jgi:3-deoxy-7-phosphoheptulonate synthase